MFIDSRLNAGAALRNVGILSKRFPFFKGTEFEEVGPKVLSVFISNGPVFLQEKWIISMKSQIFKNPPFDDLPVHILDEIIGFSLDDNGVVNQQ